MSRGRKNICIVATLLLCIGILTFVSAQKFLSAEENEKQNTSGKQEIDLTPYKIQVVDSDTRKGVPMVEFKSTNGVLYYTDSNGYIYYREPGLIGQQVWFAIQSHGYKYPKESFDGVGEAINIRPDIAKQLGIEKILSIRRDTTIAERLYRLTGQGIYSDSIAFNIDTPIDEPVLNAKVMNQGPAQAVIYNDKIYWFWEKTVTTSGKSHLLITGATADLPDKGGLDPYEGVNFDYFKDDKGFAKELFQTAPQGTAWVVLNGLMTAKDDNGTIKLIAGYAAYSRENELIGRGLLNFNDEKKEFELLKEFDINNKWQFPRGNAVLYEDGGKEYWLFMDAFTVVRVPNDYNAIQDQGKYEAFTPLKSGTEYKEENTELNLEGNTPVWSWKSDAPPISQAQESSLIKYGVINTKDAYFQVKDQEGKSVELISTSIQWNDFRKKWVMLAQRGNIKINSGDIYYCESDAPVGPWINAKLIVSHTDYAFNKPIQHPYLSADGKSIYFEANLSNEGYRTKAIPQYNNNQMMYMLDLEHKKLGLTPAS